MPPTLPESTASILTQPSGVITFLFSDIEQSTQLWELDPPAMQTAVARHDALLRHIFVTFHGYVFKTIGDQFCVAFGSPQDAWQAVLAAQRALQAEPWPTSTPLRVRMALHTGEAEERDDDYFGTALNFVARLLSAGHGGQVLLSEETQMAIVRHLPPQVALRDLGLRRFKGIKKPQRVFQMVLQGLLVHFPPLKTLDLRPSNLPSELTPFVGREAEITAVATLLRRPTIRLVTLTGPGGTGKTRLSLKIAAHLLDEYEDGVFFVPLAAIHDEAFFLQAITQALGIPENRQQAPLETIIQYCRSRQMLLVLDNFEQLVESSPLINHILQGAPQVKVLVTSREELQIYGEYLYPVSLLPVPTVRESQTLDILNRFAATALFRQRVQASAPDLQLQDSDAPTIANICQTLDGLPLAIELAAARARQFSLNEIAQELSNRLAFLNSGPRDLPSRQRTLRGCLAWSYDALSPEEQTVFARTAVFVSGWALEAAQALMTEFSPAQVRALLNSLMMKSLIQKVPGDTPRFTLLETIREYAGEQLAHMGELERMREKHALYYQQLVEGSESGINTAQQSAIFHQFEMEHDNLRQAMSWGLAEPTRETALRISGVLWRFWTVRSYLREGRQWLEQALTTCPMAPADVRAKALWGAGRVTFYQKDYSVSRSFLADSLALYRQLEMPEHIASVLSGIGEIAFVKGEFDVARPVYEESLALHRSVKYRRGIAHTLDNLGQIATEQGDYGEAVRYFEESLALRREQGSFEGIAVGATNLAEVLQRQHIDDRAEALMREALPLFRELGHPTGIIVNLNNLGKLEAERGNLPSAVACYAEALVVLADLHQEEAFLVAHCLTDLVEVLLQLNRDYLAAQLLGMAENWLEQAHFNAVKQEGYEACCTAVQLRLGEADWTKARQEGRKLLLEEVVQLVAP